MSELARQDTPTEEEMEAERLQADILERLANELESKKDVCVTHKTSVENRMLADEAQYWGFAAGGTSKADVVSGYGDGPATRNRSPGDNKTRSKTRIASARIGDMLFPTNSPNWGLRPTPYPEVSDEDLRAEWEAEAAKVPPPAEGQPPAPPPPIDIASLSTKVATRKCRAMSRRIRDVLSESQYAKIGRKVIFDGCKLGTGIVKGPYVRNRTRKRYNTLTENGESIEVLTVSVERYPAVARVSPWMFFPQPARTMDECEYAFELHLFNRTKMIQMVTTHGFSADATRTLLRAGPTRGVVEGMLAQRAAVTNQTADANYMQCWAVWEYHGPIDAEVLEALGLVEREEIDPLISYYGEIWLADGHILRINLSPLEADNELPYHVWCYEEDETSVFGFGIPFVMRDDQYVIDLMWDAMTHNAAVSAGPQVAILKGVVTPADGSYNIRGPKLWYINDEDLKISDAIQTMVIPSTINQNMPLYQQAKQNADENTNLPVLAGDMMGQQVTQALDGRAQIMNQQNIVQRAAAHQWDDNVTARLISRLYDWFMQHDPDPAIKGDYEIEVRGASYLLVKDVQAQHAQLLLQMAAQDPELRSKIHMDELYRVYLSFMDIPTDQLLKTPEQVEQEQAQQQPDPIQELEVQERQARIAKLQAETNAIGTSVPQDPNQPSPDKLMEVELAYLKLQDKEADRAAQVEVATINMNTQMMRVASDEKISYQQIMADMEKFQRSQQSKDYFDAARLRLDEFRDRLKALNLGKGYDTFG